ncbi:inorganic phosphate transporter [Candidatus Bathyarchaeota archaeon]|nr:inorganic phosphate transporter [Candidatus Bathyarchaeota archaeon]
MNLVLLISFGMTLYIAFSIGANDETMAPLAGSRFIRVSAAALLGSLMAFLGAVFLGYKVEETIGKKLLVGPITATDVLIIVFSIATWLTIASWWGWPVSTTHSVVGAAIGLGLMKRGVGGIAWGNMGRIIGAWVASPLIGLLSTLILDKVIKRLLYRQINGLRQQMELSRKAAFLLLAWTSLTAFSRGANDIGNATAFLSAAVSQDPLLIRIIVGIGWIFGLTILGRRVIKSVGLNLVNLDPMTALVAQISVALTMFIGTLMGLPLSGTHVLVGAITGLGLAEGTWINIKGLKEIFYTWIATFITAAGISAATYFILAAL